MFPHKSSSTRDETIISILDNVMNTNPNGVAVDYERGSQLTYADLRHQVDILSRSLRPNIKAGQLVFVLLPRSFAQIVSIVSIIQLGAVYVPFDIEIPQARLEALLRRVKPPLILTTTTNAERLNSWGFSDCHCVDPNLCLQQPLNETGHIEPINVKPNDLAVVLFTSGSTGEPKGVQLSHKNLIEPIRYLSKAQKITKSARIVQFAGCAFDVHLLDIFCALFNGSTLCQVSKDNLLSRLAFWINQMEADMIHLTPSVLSILNPQEVPLLKYMLSSGETITKQIIEKWAPRVTLTNLYGPCEASSIVGSQLSPGTDPSVIGEATPHANLILLDEHGNAVPQGSAGEIYCSGESVFLGYLGNKAATASKFKLVGPEMSSFFGTGDLASMTPEGKIQLLGRIDSQVKVNGQRVEPLEVEHVLLSHCAKAVVKARKDANGQVRLHSFVTKSHNFCGPSDPCLILEDEESFVQKLDEVCQSSLPSFMLPQIIVVSAIPLNASDKIDNRRLDDIFMKLMDSETDPTSQMTSLELQVARIIERRIFHKIASVDHHLLSLGLSSLDAMVVIKEIEETCAVSLRLSDVIRNPTIRCLSRMVEQQQQHQRAGNPVSIAKKKPPNNFTTALENHPLPEKSSDFQSYPYFVTTSTAQDRIYAAQKLLNNSAYNCNFVLNIDNFELDLSKLFAVVRFVCGRHETLQSTYHDYDDSISGNSDASDYPTPPLAIQKVHDIENLQPEFESSSLVELSDISTSSESGVYDVAMSMIKDKARRLFDLEKDSPIRVGVYQVGNSHFIVHFNIHHISMDEWSFGKLCEEIELAYNGSSRDKSQFGDLSTRPVQYSEFARWSRNASTGTVRQENLEWWKENIGGDYAYLRPAEISPVTVDRQTQEMFQDNSRIFVHAANPDHVSKFQTQICNSTPFIGWLSLAQTILGRISRKQKFLLGVPATERGEKATFQNVIGFCLNTLPFPVTLDESETFEMLMNKTHQTFFDCMAHSSSYEEIINHLGDSRDSGRGGLAMSVMFIYHDMRRQDNDTTAPSAFLRDANPIQLTETGAEFPLIIHFDPNQSNPRLLLQYRADTFSEDFIGGIGRAFDVILGDVISKSSTEPICQLNIVSKYDMQRLDDWSATTEFSSQMRETWINGKGTNLVELFKRAAYKFSDAVACESINGESLSYMMLYRKASALAKVLQKRHLGKSRVGIVAMDKCPALVVSVLAVLMTGAAFVMVDPTHKTVLNQNKIEVTDASLVIVNDDSTYTINDWKLDSKIDIVNVTSLDLTSDTTEELEISLDRSDSAYLCFTSGSTGNPKCFAIPHSSAAAAIMGSIEVFGLRPGLRCGFLCNVTFDVAVSNIFTTLISGATMCIAPTDSLLTSLDGTLNTLSVNYIETTPSVVATLSGPSQVPSLRKITLIGEPPSLKVFQTWVDHVEIYNSYGPAETTITSHAHKYSSDDDPRTVTRNVGKMFPAIRSLIHDAQGRPLLPGTIGYHMIGEQVSGKFSQLSSGYIAPISANKRFQQHNEYGRFFNTGDLAFFDFDGNVNIIGREDDQVKLHGIRFDLGDIESAIDSLLDKGSKTTAVICKLVQTGASVLVAFLQHPIWADGPRQAAWQKNVQPEDNKLLCSLRDKVEVVLHDVMIPRYWIPICWVPRSNTGKANRALLKEWFSEIQDQDPERFRAYATLQNQETNSSIHGSSLLQDPLGQKVVQCWKETLGLSESEINPEASFFHCGGDSITAIRFCSKMRSQNVTGCSVSQLYETPSISRLVDALRSRQSLEDSPETSKTVDSTVEYPLLGSRRDYSVLCEHIKTSLAELAMDKSCVMNVLPLLSMQHVMLLQSMENPELYVTQVIYTFAGSFDILRFESAWKAVVRAHPSLRTTFMSILTTDILEILAVETNGSDHDNSSMSVLPLPTSDKFESTLRQDRLKGFKLGGPMQRMAVFKEADELHHAVLTIHHAITDGWSFNIILHELSKAYQGNELFNGPSPSEFLAFDMGRDKSEAKKYWQHMMADFDPYSFSSSDAKAIRSNDITPSTLRMNVKTLHSDVVSQYARSVGVTPATIFQAAMAILLSRATNRKDVAFGVTVSGRTSPVNGLADTVGLFMNTVPLRLSVEACEDVNKWLPDISRIFSAGMLYDYVSISEIFSDHASHGKLFDSILVYENYATDTQDLFGENLALQKIDGREFSDVPFMIVVEHVLSGTDITFKWNSSLLTTQQASSWQLQYASIVEDIISDQSLPLTVANIGQKKPYAELQQSVTAYENLKQCSKNVDSSDTLISLFKNTVLKSPDSTALETPTGSMTYKTLDHESDVVAMKLLEYGVSQDDIIPIIFSRSTDMIVAMLGVMKAGASYCPVDVHTPTMRQLLLIRKVEAKFVLGQVDHMSGLSAMQDLVSLSFRLLFFDDLLEESIENLEQPLPKISHNQTCYVLFTSGSSGQPKGCILSHRAVVNVVKETCKVYHTDSFSRVLLFANYIFDASVVDIYGCLSTGASLCIADSEDVMGDLEGMVNRMRITSLHLTPSVIKLLEPDRCTSLKTLISGGEKLPLAVRDTWASRVRLIDGYGPSETAVQVSATLVEPSNPTSVIPQPLPGNFLIVLDSHLNIARVGQVGEIFIGGVQLFEGYVGDPALTLKAYISSPFDTGSRLYRTGDLGRFTEGMAIQILGRKDSQIKFSGQRIEVEEIESILNSAPTVARSAVAVYESQLCAIVQAKSSKSTCSIESLSSFCANRLPTLLVPTKIILAEVPLTASKKINRRQVHEDLSTRKAENNKKKSLDSPSLTPEEEFISSVVEKILGRPVTDVNLAFPYIGLNSLSLMQLRGVLARKYSEPLTYSQLSRAGNIRKLATMLKSARTSDITTRKIKEQPVTGSFPALPMQSRMWMAQERLQDDTYNVFSLAEIEDVNSERLLEALKSLVEKVDIFKITFSWSDKDNLLYQNLHDLPRARIFMRDVSHLDKPFEEIQSQCILDNKLVFDLHKGPLAHFTIYNCGFGKCFLYYNIHHILVDEWTCQQILASLSRIYYDDRCDIRFISVTNAAQSFQSLFTEEQAAGRVAKFVAMLEDIPVLDTKDWPEPSVDCIDRQTHTVSRKLPRAKISSFMNTCLTAGISQFSSFLSLFQLVMHRYTAANDLSVLIPISTRGSDPEMAEALGNFTNTVLVRSNLQKDDAIKDFLRRTADFVDFAMDNSLAPLEEILSYLHSSVSEHSVMFVFNESLAQPFKTMRDQSSKISIEQTAMFDICFNITGQLEDVSIELQYNTGKFDSRFMEGLVECYLNLITSLDSQIDHKVQSLNFCSPTHTSLIDRLSNLESVKEPVSDCLLHEIFERQAQDTPDRIAIDFLDRGQIHGTTYKELNERASEISAVLKTNYDVQFGDIIPIYADQGPEFVAALLGILKSGAVYTPLPRDSTSLARAVSITQKCNAKVVIADVFTIDGLEVSILNVNKLPQISSGSVTPTSVTSSQISSDFFSQRVVSDSIAYIIWTSGTTGIPKGVQVTHAAAVTAFYVTANEVYGGIQDRVLQFSSPMFDVSLEDIFTAFARGGTICTARSHDLLYNIETVISALKPTAAGLTNSVISLLDPKTTPLRILVAGGEPLSGKVKQAWIGSSTRLINGYGPAENTVLSTYSEVQDSTSILSIGRPISSVTAFILDLFENLSLPYVRGEIFLGGSQLFDGYFCEPQLSEKVLIRHPRYGTLYSTGDIAYYDNDGNINISGRADDQVKIHGQRIELGGIAFMIEQQANVKRAIVVKHAEQLAAFITWTENHKTTSMDDFAILDIKEPRVRELVDFLTTKLSSSTVPVVWVEINSVPMTLSGKIDKSRLKSMLGNIRTSTTDEWVPPEGDVEQSLHDCLCQTLNMDSVSVLANVFELGMDSFLAMGFISRIRKVLPQFSVNSRDVAESLNLRSLARRIQLNSTVSIGTTMQIEVPPTSQLFDSIETPIPASSMQERFYLSQMVFGDATYNLPIAFELVGIDFERWQHAFEDIIKENAIFRTSFQYTDRLWQTIHNPKKSDFKVYNFEHLDSEDAKCQMQKICQSDAGRSFDLQKPYPIRYRAFLVPQDKKYVYINMHHIIADEFSVQSMLADLTSRSAGFGYKEKSQVHAAQYADYSTEEARILDDSLKVNDSYNFWKVYLCDVAPTILPPLASSQVYEKTHGVFNFDFSIQKNFLNWSKREGMTNFSALLSLFEILLSQIWNSNDLSVLIPVSQRPLNSPDPFYGCFINTLPIRAQVDGSHTLEDTLRRLTRELLDVLQNSVIPYEKILGHVGADKGMFKIMFVYHEEHQSPDSGFLPTHDILSKEPEGVAPKFPVTFSVNLAQKDTNPYIKLTVDYDRTKIDDESIVILCEHFETLISATAQASPQTLVGCLETLTNSEAIIIHQSLQYQVSSEQERFYVHNLLEAQVAQNPDKIACEFEGQHRVTYRELWAKIENISTYLDTYATGSNGKVGIFMEAGFDRIAAIFATVKCGMTYVPLEVTLPPARNAFIVEDCNARVILASGCQENKYRHALEQLDSAKPKHIPICLIPDPVPVQKTPTQINPKIKPSDLAYVLYTSGSTGKPKGVEIPHSALSNSVKEHIKLYRLDSSSRLLQFAPWTFDVSVVDIFGTLAVGATLCLGRRNFLLSQFEDVFNMMQVTHIATTPTVIKLLPPSKAPSLKVLAIGGEPMTKGVRDLWSERALLLNVYGPTETTVNVLSCVVKPDSNTSIIGKSLGNVQALILNEQLSEVPIGCIGQLAIGGPQVARGYLNRPKENKSFIEHSRFGRLYLTGDLAKFTKDGSVLCLGRRDTQVKLRGQRIELGEIEDIATTCQSIQRATSFVVNKGQAEGLVLFFTMDSDNTSTASGNGKMEFLSLSKVEAVVEEAYQTMTQKLPPYFIPKYWIPSLAMPTNANGKIDRKAITRLVMDLSDSEINDFIYRKESQTTSSLPLVTDAEKAIAEAMKKVLGTDKIDASSNFFSLSGDSISAIRLNSTLRSVGYSITVQDIYENPVVSQLAASVMSRTTPNDQRINLSPAHGKLHGTPIIEWFFGLQKQNPHWYNQSYVLRMKDMGALQNMPAAWAKVVEVHPSLRLRCDLSSEKAAVHIPEFTSSTDCLVTEHGMSSMDEFSEYLKKAQSSLCIENGPISALTFVTTAEDTYCIIAVHHLAIDIVSWQIIFDDLEKALRGETIAPEYNSFRSWSLYVQEQQNSRKASNYLPEVDTSLPPVRTNSGILDDFAGKMDKNTNASARIINVELSWELTKSFLTTANKPYRTEPVDLLLASLAMAMSKWRRLSLFEVIFESHGRDFKNRSLDFSRTVGWFTYLFKILLTIDHDTSIGDFIAHAKDSRRAANQALDFTHDAAVRSQYPTIMFNYLGSYSREESGTSFSMVHREELMGAVEDPNNLRPSVLDISCAATDGILDLSVIFSDALHTEDDIQVLLNAWRGSLQEILDFCSVHENETVFTGSDFPMLPFDAGSINQLVEKSLLPQGISVDSVEDILPATGMQNAMLLASQEFGSYQEMYRYRIEGNLDCAKFQAAWSQVIRKHSSLRTVFIPCDGFQSVLNSELLQVIIKPTHFNVQVSLERPQESSPGFEYGQPLIQLSLYKIGAEQFEFLWTCHHAIVDGWSMGVIMNDLYQASGNNLSQHALQFKDIVAFVNAEHNQDQTKKFWQNELNGLSPTILVDYSNSPQQQIPSPQNSRIVQSLHCLAEDAKLCAASRGMTISSLLRAAWTLALSFHCGENEVMFGVTSSGRHYNIHGIEGAVGPCITTVPFAVNIESESTLDVFLEQIKKKDSAILSHQSMSLGQIYKATNSTNLFNTLLIYQNHPKYDDRTAQPFSMHLEYFEETTDVPLNLLVGQNNDNELSVTALLHGNHFSDKFMKGVISSFGMALQQICHNQNLTQTKIRELDLLDKSFHPKIEKNEHEWSSQDLSVWNLFVQQSMKTPDKAALEFYSSQGMESLTYYQLLEMSRRGGATLRAAGVTKGGRVVLYLDKSLETVAAVFSVLSIEAAYVPIEVGTPVDRISELLQQSNPRLIITSSQSASLFSPSGRQVLPIEDIFNQENDISGPPQQHEDVSNDLAAVLFTSGTTGVPKGVCMPNRQIAGYALNMVEAYGYDQNSVIFNFARYIFDVWITDVFGGFCCGATVCIANQKDTVNDLTSLLKRSRTTAINLTSSVAALLDPEELPDLKSMVLTGEPATKHLISLWAPKVYLVNSYGPTEAAVIAWTDVHSSSDSRCVGNAVRGMDIVILDDHLRKVPVGVPGNLYTSGFQLSLGYWGRQDLTAKAYVNSPFEKGTIMYSTGDIGAYDSKGKILLLNRKDKQVKLRGQRIELGEIENAIRQAHPRVTVSLLPDKQGIQQLIAFFESDSDDVALEVNRQLTELIHREARRLLPSYMVPAAYIPLRQIPLTVNGKVDSRTLESIYQSHIDSTTLSKQAQQSTRQNLTTTERALQEQVKKIFGVSDMSIDVDLTTSILDSLSSMRLAGSLRRFFKLPINLKWIMENRTIEDLASKIDSHIASRDQMTVAQPEPTSSSAVVESVVEFSKLDGNTVKKRLFCIHPASGLSFEFRNLVKYLPHMSITGINDPNYGVKDAYPDIPTMAKTYHSIITKLQPTGPYYITGYSFGGHVALELARLLHQSNNKVTLVLVDSSAHNPPPPSITPRLVSSVINRFGMKPPNASCTPEEHNLRTNMVAEVERNLHLMSRYTPQPYDGPAVFLRAYDDEEEERTFVGDRSNGYEAVIGDLEVLPLYGNHYKVFTDKRFLDHNAGVFGTVFDNDK